MSKLEEQLYKYAEDAAGQLVPDEMDVPHHQFSDGFYGKVRKLTDPAEYKKCRRRRLRCRGMKIAAACIVICLVAVPAAFPAAGSFYERIFRMIRIAVGPDEEEGLREAEFGYLPDGMEILGVSGNGEAGYYLYQAGDPEQEQVIFQVFQRTVAEGEKEITVEAEGATEKIETDGGIYYVTRENGSVSIAWDLEENFFVISGDLDQEELLRVAEGISLE